MIMNRSLKMLALAAANIALVALGGCAGDEPKPVPASANACPSWADSPADSHTNAGSDYLGCANALNLRHMVEDPNDLKQGRDLGPADGARQTKAVKNYEDGKVKTSSGSGESGTKFTPNSTGASESQ
jgi:hypothetical protein